MKRLRRWLLNLAVAISLVLFPVAAIAWPLTCWRGAAVIRISGSSYMSLWASSGSLSAGGYVYPQVDEETMYTWKIWSPASERPRANDDSRLRALWFVWINKPTGDPGTYQREVGIPFWFLALIFGLPVILWVKRRRRVALPLIHCKKCGYDLRATPQRCPECGTIAVAAPQNN